MIFAGVTNYLQTPPASFFYFSSYWCGQAYTTHTEAPTTSLCSFTKPLL